MDQEMSVGWNALRGKFDHEVERFIFVAGAMDADWSNPHEEEVVCETYNRQQHVLLSVIGEIVSFVPVTNQDAEDRIDLGIELAHLDYSLDQHWLGFEADKILRFDCFETADEL